MLNSTYKGLIKQTTSLECFFKERIEYSFEKNHFDGNDDALWYLTNLLCDYSTTDSFLEKNGTRATLTPLAEYNRRAIESTTQHERRLQLQKLGDVAIVVAGLFSGALTKKAVGVDYYISMGEAAYGTLANETTHSSRGRALRNIFESLSNDFSDYVIALSEIPTKTENHQSLLQLFDKWQESKHPALAKQLQQKGVILKDDSDDCTIAVH